MKKLFILDGSSILSSCFYGQTPTGFAIAKTDEERERYHKNMLQTKDGQFINGVYGMTKYLLKLFKEINPSHIVVTWDTTRNTFRRTIYPEYKGNRKQTPFELSSQFPIMQQFLRDLGIKQYLNDLEEKDMNNLYESDDFIGSIVKHFEEEIPIAIISKDKDMLQLVSDNTTVWLMTSKSDELKDTYYYEIPDNSILFSGTFPYTIPVVEGELGVHPTQVVDLKALLGDTSDNIPGVKGVGETSAPKLIKEYGNIENLYDTIRHFNELEHLTDKNDIKILKNEIKEIKDFWKNDLGISKSPLNSLMKTSEDENEVLGEKAAILSKELAQIKLDIHIECNLDSFKFVLDEENLHNLLSSLEFYSLFNNKKTGPEPILPYEPKQQTLF